VSPGPAGGFRRVLIANRGEIALRIVRACRDAGMTSIAVYAGDDRGAPFAALADEAVALPGTGPAGTYLASADCWPRPSGPAPTRFTPGTGSWPRTPASPTPCRRPG